MLLSLCLAVCLDLNETDRMFAFEHLNVQKDYPAEYVLHLHLLSLTELSYRA